jgi:DNA-binding NarL/FixJ family response regulator
MSEHAAPGELVEISELGGSDPLATVRSRHPHTVVLVAPDDTLAMASARARITLHELFGIAGRADDFSVMPEGFRRHVRALREAIGAAAPPVSALTPDLCCRGTLLHSEAGDYLLVTFESIARRRPRHRLAAYGLTQRESEVAELVLDGLGNRAIADRLHVSENTVESHIKRVMTKARAPSRAAFVSKVLSNASD